MAVKYGQLVEFTKKMEKLNEKQKEDFLESCCKKLAARLLQKVTERTKPGNYSKEIEVTRSSSSAGLPIFSFIELYNKLSKRSFIFKA